MIPYYAILVRSFRIACEHSPQKMIWNGRQIDVVADSLPVADTNTTGGFLPLSLAHVHALKEDFPGGIYPVEGDTVSINTYSFSGQLTGTVERIVHALVGDKDAADYAVQIHMRNNVGPVEMERY